MGNVRGIDVSHYQQPTWRTEGQTFAFIQAANGSDRQSSFAGHEKHATSHGVYVIPYLYARGVPVNDQVLALLQTAPGYDRYAVDYEGDSRGLSVTDDQMRAIVAKLHGAGKRVIAYAGQSTMKDWGQDDRWYVDPGPVDSPASWRFRQHGSGRPDGDEFNGDAQAWEEWLGMAQLTITSDTPHTIHVRAGAPVLGPGGQKVDTQQAAVDRLSPFRAHIGSGGPVYWAVYNPGQGAPQLGFVALADATDKGTVTGGGPSPADLTAATAAGFSDAKAKALAAVAGI